MATCWVSFDVTRKKEHRIVLEVSCMRVSLSPDEARELQCELAAALERLEQMKKEEDA